jgi:hypothetical protein
MCIRNKEYPPKQIKTGYKVLIRNTITEDLYFLYRSKLPLNPVKPIIVKTRLSTLLDDSDGFRIGYHYWETFESANKHMFGTVVFDRLDENEELVIVRVRSRTIRNTGFGGVHYKLDGCRQIESADIFIHPFILARKSVNNNAKWYS